MKKIFIISAICMTATLFAVSCQKNLPAVTKDAQTGTQTFSCIAPEECESAVRAELGGTGNKQVFWNNGDQISFFVNTDNSTGAVYSTALVSPSLQADFTGTGAEQCSVFSNKYVAFYPASQVYSWGTAAEAKRRLRFFIPSEQIAVTNSFPQNCCPMIASTDDPAHPLTFSHIAGYFKFTIDKDSPSITRVYLTAGDNNWFSGRFTLELSDLTTIGSSSINRYVIFRNSDDSPLAVGDYYIAVRPRTWTGGFNFIFTDDEGSKAKVSYTADDKTIAKGHVLPVGTVRNLTFKKIGDIYQESSVNKGIVVGFSGEDSYYVMSLAGVNKTWSTMPDLSSTLTTAFDSSDGAGNTALIKAAVEASDSDSITEDTFPAAYQCINMGEGWYLPGSVEFCNILNALEFTDEDKYSAFSTKITDADGNALPTGTNYSRFWTSMYKNNNMHITYKKGDGSAIYYMNKTYSQSQQVRCLKKVSL